MLQFTNASHLRTLHKQRVVKFRETCILLLDDEHIRQIMMDLEWHLEEGESMSGGRKQFEEE